MHRAGSIIAGSLGLMLGKEEEEEEEEHDDDVKGLAAFSEAKQAEVEPDECGGRKQ
jgi:hypothetical protein